MLQWQTPPAQVAAGDDDHDCKWNIFASWWKEKHHQRKLHSVKTILGTSIGAGCSNQMQLAQGHHRNADLALVLPIILYYLFTLHYHGKLQLALYIYIYNYINRPPVQVTALAPFRPPHVPRSTCAQWWKMKTTSASYRGAKTTPLPLACTMLQAHVSLHKGICH